MEDAHTCPGCGHRFLVWRRHPDEGDSPMQAEAELEAMARGVDLVVIEWDQDPATLPPPFDCPSCGGELIPLGSLN